MRLSADDRARVPFALVGVVLLVGSASFSAAMVHRPAPAERPDAVAASNRVEGTVATAIHRGTKRAARHAAREPVLAPADTPVGRLVGRNETFRDYLRLRVFLAVRSSLEHAAVTVGSAEAVPALPETPDADALERALDRVTLTRVDGGVRVRIENVTVRLRVGGRVVETRNRTVERTVATPVLAVHERVQRYERRLNRGPSEGPGLGRRLTARMNAIAWTRGYAQYGGAPISNVVSTRHLELQTNGALLASQHAVFGRSDPAGRRATTNAALVVGATDVVKAGASRLGDADTLPHRPGVPTSAPAPSPPAPARPPAAADGNVTVGVDLTADEAYAAFVSGTDPTTMERTVGEVFGADVRLVGARRARSSSRTRAAEPPGANWTLVGTERTRTVSVERTDEPGPAVAAEQSWHPLSTFTRLVTIETTIRKHWERGEGPARETRTTTGRRTRVELVTVAIVGRHAHSSVAPRRGIELVHRRGGPLDGPNLRGIAPRARERIEDRYGSPDALVRQYVDGGLPTATIHLDGRRPDGLEDWLTADLATLRDRVRNLSVTVPRRELGAGRTNPAALLADRLAARRAALVDAPATYGSVAAKARIAVRSAYLAAVIDRLEHRAGERRRTRSRFDRVLGEHGIDGATLSASLAAGASTERPAAHPAATGGPLGALNASVSATPAYLTTAALTHDRLPAVPAGERYHPLVARNTNLFTLPYADAADGVVGDLFGFPDRTSLASAAATLRSTNRALDRRSNPDLARRRDALRRSVRRALGYLRTKALAALLAADVPPAAAADAVREGFGRWETPAARALAATNGSLAGAVATAAARRSDARARVRGPLLAARLRVTLAHAREDARARPRQPSVNRTATLQREVTRTLVEEAIQREASVAAETVTRRLGGRVTFAPAGLPVAPVPGYWYVTTNVWTVTVGGEYLRFAVTVPSGTPGRQVRYVRDGGDVALDWDGDGTTERVGRSTRVSFRVSTAVLVVVPPGPPGVGDRNGDADERSPGWPDPGVSDAE